MAEDRFLRIRLRISDADAPQPGRPPGRYLIAKNDYDMVWSDFGNITHVSRPTRNGAPWGTDSGRGLPATARFNDDTPVKFNCDMQFWLHELSCRKLSPGVSETQKKRWFYSAWRGWAWMTNNTGADTRRDCINDTNVGKDWIQAQPMASGGALLKYVDENPKEIFFEAINPLTDYRQYHPDIHKHLFFYPTLSCRKPIYEKGYIVDFEEWYQEPFAQYDGHYVVPIYGYIYNPKSSTGYCNRISKSRVRMLADNEPVPNPFICDGWTKVNPYEGY
jgi:hypothetical protein